MTAQQGSPRDWHRLFGLLLTDFFTGTPFIVEVERDLSTQQQLLDVVIVRRGSGRLHARLPDGLEDLVAHNLITFKSHREALDDWAVKELIGHHVAYRKLVSPSPSALLPESDFRLYAVCARFPRDLSGRVPWQQRQTGVYDCRWGTDEVRVVVAGELPQEPQNAPLHLFSASDELVGFGQGIYRQHSKETSGLLRLLFQSYKQEDLLMPFTMDDFNRCYIKKVLPELTPEERQEALESLPPEERQELFQSLPLQERQELFQSLPLQERQELFQSLPLEERLAGLSSQEIQRYLDQLNAQQSAQRKRRRKKE